MIFEIPIYVMKYDITSEAPTHVDDYTSILKVFTEMISNWAELKNEESSHTFLEEDNANSMTQLTIGNDVYLVNLYTKDFEALLLKQIKAWKGPYTEKTLVLKNYLENI